MFLSDSSIFKQWGKKTFGIAYFGHFAFLFFHTLRSVTSEFNKMTLFVVNLTLIYEIQLYSSIYYLKILRRKKNLAKCKDINYPMNTV